MAAYTYNGTASSMRITGVLFVKGKATKLNDEQVKKLKADRFGKAFIEDGRLAEIKAENVTPKADKPVSQMTVPELEAYIKANGGEYASDDKKPELLVIAQAIEDAQ